jgi:hypothetical protein
VDFNATTKVEELRFSFSDFANRRDDFGLGIHTCIRKRLIFLYEFVYSTLDYITVNYGNPGKIYSLIFISYSYPSIFNTLNTLSNLKHFLIFKVYDVLGLFQIFQDDIWLVKNFLLGRGQETRESK